MHVLEVEAPHVPECDFVECSFRSLVGPYLNIIKKSNKNEHANGQTFHLSIMLARAMDRTKQHKRHVLNTLVEITKNRVAGNFNPFS